MAATTFILVDPALTDAQTAADSSLTEAGGSILVNTDKVTIATATGNTAIAGTLGVTGAITADSSITAGSIICSGSTVIGTTLGVTGASTLASAAVTGAATVGSTLGVTGKTTGTTAAFTGLTNYVDQAAAVTAGLGNGDLYHTDGAVMVVYGV